MEFAPPLGGLEMKRLTLSLIASAALTASALAADLPAVYTKAPAIAQPTSSWTGFYIFGGAGGGLWQANSNVYAIPLDPASTSRDQRLGGDGWFGTVGAGYDWQFDRSWVAGIFADGQFGSIRGSLTDPNVGFVGDETLRTSYAAGARLGYLVAPNVLSYLNAGYSGSEWSGATLSSAGIIVNGTPLTPITSTTTPSFSRSGWFVGGGVENNLNIFGITAPGWFMKTEYRAAYYGRATLTEAPFNFGGPFNDVTTLKPWVQTVSTSLVYRFNSNGPMASDLPASRTYTKAPVMASNWTGFYAFGGAGGGLWDAKENVTGNTGGANGFFIPDFKSGGAGWFGTIGVGYDWQFNRSWVVGLFADGQFGNLTGSLTDIGLPFEGNETLRDSYAAGARVGYLVAPNVLSYVNGGYSGSQWSGVTLTNLFPGAGSTSTSSFNRDGWFLGGGVENSLNIFGISAPGWFMKTEYRAAYYGRATVPATPVNAVGTIFTDTLTFKPIVQTVSTSLVYRFNWGGPLVAKY
jgi:outer membrane immunogenic protein